MLFSRRNRHTRIGDKIDDIAFRGCENLKKMVIPESVKEFGWGVLNGCENVVVVCKEGSAAAYCDKKNVKRVSCES
mgnify:CR=1 FL=1